MVHSIALNPDGILCDVRNQHLHVDHQARDSLVESTQALVVSAETGSDHSAETEGPWHHQELQEEICVFLIGEQHG